MAKTSRIVKQLRQKRAIAHRLSIGLAPKPRQLTRFRNRCSLCGRCGGYMRKFGWCRICFREAAQRGEIMGLKKSSW